MYIRKAILCILLIAFAIGFPSLACQHFPSSSVQDQAVYSPVEPDQPDLTLVQQDQTVSSPVSQEKLSLEEHMAVSPIPEKHPFPSPASEKQPIPTPASQEGQDSATKEAVPTPVSQQQAAQPPDSREQQAPSPTPQKKDDQTASAGNDPLPTPEAANDKDNKDVIIPVTLSRPLEDIRTSYSRFYLNGASDPSKPLYLNGEPVTNRSKQGYFGMLVSLAEGSNSFTVSQGDSEDTRVIYRIPNEPEKPMDSPDIIKSSVFPQKQEYRTSGEKITLSCKAPIGASVTVELNGQKLAMTPGKTSHSSGLYPVTYTCAYTLPELSGSPRVVELGTPVYTMEYNGKVKTRKAPGNIGVIMDGAPYYAKVVKDMIFTYAEPDTDGGGVHELYKGMVDYITGMTGSYARLSTGQYVLKSAVEIFSEIAEKPVIRAAEYTAGEKWDTFRLDISGSPAAYITSDGITFNIHISSGSKAEAVILPENDLFSSAAVVTDVNKTEYILSVKNIRDIEGYTKEKTATGLEIKFKHRVYAAEGDKPLTGITIMVDPGHGGEEPGTIGPLGMKYAEKDMNLDNGKRLKAELEALGATVLMTRTKDVTVSLNNRLEMSRKAKPDMFISIHANSMADNVDNTEYFGFSTYYREAHARFIAEQLLEDVTTTLNRNNRKLHVKNFYVIRGTWTPSFLIECGFVPNPVEFEWLTNAAEQQKLMRVIAQSIANYFASPNSSF